MSPYLFEPPFNDELVTSWIARNALFYGMKPCQLSTLVFEDTDAWKADLDVYINPTRLEILSLKTRTNKRKISKLTFFASCSYFYNQTEKTAQVKWVMPLGVRTRNQRFGLQYCPCCLIEDGERPYFRKSWRLGFNTCCVFHHVQLHDRCPKCKNPIDIKRLQKSPDEILYQSEDICHCSKCGFDFRKTKYVIASNDEYEINRKHFTLSTLGYGQAGDMIFNYSNLYFEGIRRLLSLIICKPKGKKLFFYLVEQLKISNPYHKSHHLEPERLDLTQRRLGLQIIDYLLADWPNRFLDACLETHTTTHLIEHPYLEFSFWIRDVMLFLTHDYKYFASEEEKLNIIKFFKENLDKEIKTEQTTPFVNYYFCKYPFQTRRTSFIKPK